MEFTTSTIRNCISNINPDQRVSAIMHAYYIIVQHKFFASWNDFSYDHIYDLRLYLVQQLSQTLVANNTDPPPL